MTAWALVLAFVLGAAVALVLRDVASVIRRSGSRGETLDLSASAAKGELLHLDWSVAPRVRRDVPRRPPPLPGVVRSIAHSGDARAALLAAKIEMDDRE